MVRKQRLSPEDWLKAGLDALAASGPEALKAEPLARALETTKGSFYWHFADVPAFRQALLEFWGENAALPTEPDDKTDAVAQLHALMRDGFPGASETEAAMRGWARTDPNVAATLADIDAMRLTYLGAVLRQLGVRNPEIARLLYAARVGTEAMAQSDEQSAALDTLVDLVLALR